MKAADIAKLTEEALAEAGAAGSAEELEALRIKYLGRKGMLPAIMKGLKDIEPSERSEVGRGANELKKSLSEVLKSRKTELGERGGPRPQQPAIDCSLPGTWRPTGSMHPISLVIAEAVRIFGALGFTVAEGPDVETKYRNFEALNTPDHHPSLDPRDTFWLETGECLRTQTSPVQIRVMESRPPPVRIITPGRCYRRDTTDGRLGHEPQTVREGADHFSVKVDRASTHSRGNADPIRFGPFQAHEVQVVPRSTEIAVRAEIGQRNLDPAVALEHGHHAPPGSGDETLSGRLRERTLESAQRVFLSPSRRDRPGQHEAQRQYSAQHAGMKPPHSDPALSALLIASTMKFCIDGVWPRTC